MPRPALRSLFWLSVPCLFVLLISLLASRRRGHDSLIQVKSARRVAPTGEGVLQGADVGVLLDLNADTLQYASAAWNVNARIEAGRHLLWDSKRSNVERAVFHHSESWGAGRRFRGDFSLQKVPRAWGDVVYHYDVGLRTTRRIGLGGWTVGHWNQQHSASGSILLRRTNEKLTDWKHVTHSPHLKLLGYELHSVKGSKGFPSYSARFLFEKTPPDGAGNRSELDGAYDWRGYFDQFPQESSFKAGSAFTHSYYISTGTRQERELGRFGWLDFTFDSYEIIKRGRLELEVSHNDDWPMAVEVPFSDAHGRVLSHKLSLSVSA